MGGLGGIGPELGLGGSVEVEELSVAIPGSPSSASRQGTPLKQAKRPALSTAQIVAMRVAQMAALQVPPLSFPSSFFLRLSSSPSGLFRFSSSLLPFLPPSSSPPPTHTHPSQCP